MNNFSITEINRQILNGEKSIQEISDYLPCHIHTNALDDFRILETDTTILHYLDITLEDLKNNGLEIMIKHTNPDDLQNAIDLNLKYLNNLENQKHVAFLQRVYYHKENKDLCFYTRGQVLDENRILNLSVQIQDLKLFNHNIVNLFDNSTYIKRNLPIFDSLTKREILLCKYLCQENSINDISFALNISPHTVKNHKINIYKKLNVTNYFQFYIFCEKFKINK